MGTSEPRDVIAYWQCSLFD